MGLRLRGGMLIVFTTVCGLLLDVASASATQREAWVRRSSRERSVQITGGGDAEGSEIRRQSKINQYEKHVVRHGGGVVNAVDVPQVRKPRRGKDASRFWGSESRTSGEQHVAILITGQSYRFTYKDQFANVAGGVAGFVCGSGKTTCNTTADLYIMLTDTHGIQWTAPRAQKPPYGISTDEIKAFFMKNGANNVYARILADKEFSQNMSQIEDLMVARGAVHANKSKGAWWKDAQKIQLFDKRFRPVSRMLFLRHSAYNAALSAETAFGYKYSHFLYIREDNLLYHPAYSLELLMAEGRQVSVDTHCGYGSYPDRTYFTNREGADAVFTPTIDDFVSRMTLWVQTALDGNICAKHGFTKRELQLVSIVDKTPPGGWPGWPMPLESQFNRSAAHRRPKRNKPDPLQTECLMQAVIRASGMQVQAMNFHIVAGFRYIRTADSQIKPCVARRYVHCSDHATKVAPACPKA
jgi:hypothetical protein